MNELRIGVIGCGGMGQSHMKVFNEIPRLKFTAASDAFKGNLDKVVAEHKVQGFADGEALINSGLCDAILVATPHYFHPPLAIAALKRGLHVLVEKPVAVTALAAEEVNRVAATRPDLKYAVMFQMRTVPKWRRIKEIVASGQLGEIKRVQWSVTAWFRTQAYYDSGSWRATWAGEGGGVLLNQCPHNLDILTWIAGVPAKVRAFIKLGRYHNIEVEDDVTAYFEYANGATGTFITSTGESPGNDFFEIAGDRGRVTAVPGSMGGNSFEWIQTDQSVDQFCRTTKAMWASPPSTKLTIQCPDGGSHKQVHQNFVNAILDGEPLVTPAVEGLGSVELANAMIMSGLTDKTINLPMDRQAYDTLLKELSAKSKYKPA